MKFKVLYVFFLISFLIGCSKSTDQEQGKYKLIHRSNERYLKIFDDNGKEIISLVFDESSSIESVYVNNYKGFSLRVGRQNGILAFFSVGDENLMYQSLTQLNPTDRLLIDRGEDFQSFSKTYQLFADGQTKIEHWDYVNEIMLSNEDFKEKFK